MRFPSTVPTCELSDEIEVRSLFAEPLRLTQRNGGSIESLPTPLLVPLSLVDHIRLELDTARQSEDKPSKQSNVEVDELIPDRCKLRVLLSRALETTESSETASIRIFSSARSRPQ